MYRRAENGTAIMPKPNTNRSHDDVAGEAAQNARSMSGAAVETVASRPRRSFSAAEKLRIVKAAETAVAGGERGALEALLRREGIYGAQLSAWRKQFAATGKQGLSPRKPGRKPKSNPSDRELLTLQKVNARLEHKLKVANAVIDLQKKLHTLLGLALPAMPTMPTEDT